MARYVWRVDMQTLNGEWVTVRRYLSRDGAKYRAEWIDEQPSRKMRGLQTRVLRSEPVVFPEVA